MLEGAQPAQDLPPQPAQHASRPCAASTSTSRPARWSRSWGRPGSGKSTLMHILGLLHRPDADDGPAPELRIDGRDMTRLSDGERTRIRAQQMGFVFQSLQPRPDPDRARERRARGRIRGGPGPDGPSASAADALAAVGLADRADHRPMELSGGEQQRVAIARALVNQPKLLLGDEPTGNLDTKRTAEVLGDAARLNRERGQTIVLVTHDPEVGAACDRVVLMRDGLIVGTERRTIARPELQDALASIPVPALV